jgi:hypothetical protein
MISLMIKKVTVYLIAFIILISLGYPVSQAQAEYRVNVYLDGEQMASFTIEELENFPQVGFLHPTSPNQPDQPLGPLVIKILNEAGISSGGKVMIGREDRPNMYSLRWCIVADSSLKVILDFTFRISVKLMAPFMENWVTSVTRIDVISESAEPFNPVIERLKIGSDDPEVGEVVEIGAVVEDSLGIKSLTTSIQKDGEDGFFITLVDPDLDEIFWGSWDTSSAAIGTYTVVITEANFRSGCGGDLTNLVPEIDIIVQGIPTTTTTTPTTTTTTTTSSTTTTPTTTTSTTTSNTTTTTTPTTTTTTTTSSTTTDINDGSLDGSQDVTWIYAGAVIGIAALSGILVFFLFIRKK